MARRWSKTKTLTSCRCSIFVRHHDLPIKLEFGQKAIDLEPRSIWDTSLLHAA